MPTLPPVVDLHPEVASGMQVVAADLVAETLRERGWNAEAERGAVYGTLFVDAGEPDTAGADIDELIGHSSVGAGLRNIREKCIELMLRAQPLNWSEIAGQSSAELDPAGADTKVVYDEDVQAKRTAAAARRKR